MDLELLRKQNPDSKINGVVGNNGTKMPTIPVPRDKTPAVRKKYFFIIIFFNLTGDAKRITGYFLILLRIDQIDPHSLLCSMHL